MVISFALHMEQIHYLHIKYASMFFFNLQTLKYIVLLGPKMIVNINVDNEIAWL